MKKWIVIIVLCLVFYKGSAQTGIGTTTPNASAKLEVYATDKGFLPPRVALTATNTAGPITSPATGLLVYNTAISGTVPNNVAPGYYYWNGSTWIAIIGTTTVSSITGNGTTSTLSNFSSAMNDQTGTTYTLTNADNGKVLTFSNGSAITVTVPSLSVGFNCMIIQKGAGQVSLSPSGVNILNRYNFTKTAGSYAIMSLVCIENNKYISSGDMSN
ncbi:hypothetical protein RF683_00535 [Flavobacterium sp. 20NA77.7]|uniref:Uncharacterized protein n=1 Tax=Flavobacterium nakdongensis TaxID=3073563 RepID=A0ABY9RBC9_9FLAO|nr:hypothetical protein [Flavobacterium sp. 20NA77.7]WMW77964.1 hypothetical protein RF683_00535 [Flavobacterium sp. 20NA77.7]